VTRRATDAIARAAGILAAAAAFVGLEGLGLAMVAAGLLVAGLPALALIVPGSVLVLAGMLPAIPRRR
jgi:hypothetical protein